MDYDNLTDAQIKKLSSIERRMKAINKEIREMGFNVYLANETVNILDGSSHDDSRNQRPLQENVRHDFILSGWSGGDW